MRGSILTIIVIIIISAGLQVAAQGNVQIDINATRTADAIDTEISASTTLTPFEYVATMQVVHATQTAIVTAQTGIPRNLSAQSEDGITPEIELIAEQTAEPQPAASTSGNNGPALLSTVLSFCLVVIVLFFVAGVFMMINSKNTPEAKS